MQLEMPSATDSGTNWGAAYRALRGRPRLRVGLITTLNTNIGDDFIRQGIVNVLSDVFDGQTLEYVPINKHTPLTVYPPYHPMRLDPWLRKLPRGGRKAVRALHLAAHRLGMSKFDHCDLIVQCGAPVIWPGCAETQWRHELWVHVVGRLHDRIPVLNLAAGSCYPLERQTPGPEFEEDSVYLAGIHDFCRATTVRDTLARDILAMVDRAAPVIPCSAGLAPPIPEIAPDDGPILINYMARGGHYDWDQHIDAGEWESAVRTVISTLGRQHKVEMLCHDQKELDLAKAIAPDLPRHRPASVDEYFQYVQQAKAALCNRMHASVAMAGMGIPSIAVCTDTRLRMVQEFGLPSYYVKEASADRILCDLDRLLSHRAEERERLLSLRSDTFARYAEVIRSV